METQYKVSLRFRNGNGTPKDIKIENIKPNISKDAILRFSKKYSEVYGKQDLNEAKLVQTQSKDLLS